MARRNDPREGLLGEARRLVGTGALDAAFATIHETLGGEVEKFVARRLDEGVVEDVVQEIWLAVSEALSRFNGEASLRTWVLRITRNKIVDHHRARGRRPLMDAVTSKRLAASIVRSRTGLSSVVRRRERAEIVRAALAELSEQDQELLMMRYIDDLWPREIAEVIDGELKGNTISQRILGALRRLKRALDDSGFEP